MSGVGALTSQGNMADIGKKLSKKKDSTGRGVVGENALVTGTFSCQTLLSFRQLDSMVCVVFMAPDRLA